MLTLIQDLRFALRMLGRRPVVTLATILTLALGIGANTALFSVVSSILLNPLPFEDADRLVQLQRAFQGFPTPNVSAWQALYWEEHDEPFEQVAIYGWLPFNVSLSGDGRPERLETYQVGADFFSIFGAKPALGRTFTPEEDQPGGELAALLSHQLWTTRFGADESVLGKTLRLNERSYTIAGVMPPEFRYPATADLWLPLQLDRNSQDRQAILSVTARLRPGVTAAAAAEQMAPVEQDYLEQHGDTTRQETLAVVPIQTHLYGSVQPYFLLLGGSVAFVLLIACANVASLQLTRSDSRRRELSTRIAVGANPARLLRQLLTENLFLALLGGLVGLLVCYVSLSPFLAILPSDLQLFHAVEIDRTVLLFSLTLAVLVGLATGLAPALASSKLPVTEALKEGDTRGGGTVSGRRWRLTLVVAEIALTLISLVGAALLVRSYQQLSQVRSGVNAENVLTLQLPLSPQAYGRGEEWKRLGQQLVPAIRQIPGVAAAGVATNLPMQDGPDMTFIIDGRDPEQEDGNGWGQFLGVSEGYFETLEIPLQHGRLFDQADHDAKRGQIIINEELKRRWWPNQDAVGEQIVIGPPALTPFGDPEPRTIIGVVGDVREDGFDSPAPPVLYLPLSQVPDAFAARFASIAPMGLMLRTRVTPMSVAKLAQEAVWQYDNSQPVDSILPLTRFVERTIGPQRAAMNLVSLFAALAMLLAVIGVYSVLVYLVQRRRRELGVRMAIGASRMQIMRLVLRQGFSAVGLGIVLGLLVAGAMSRVLQSFLTISALDPISYALPPLVLAVVALVAISIPAWRAGRIDPVRAIRDE